eukprot:1005232-Amphidinium_carterae.1
MKKESQLGMTTSRASVVRWRIQAIPSLIAKFCTAHDMDFPRSGTAFARQWEFAVKKRIDKMCPAGRMHWTICSTNLLDGLPWCTLSCFRSMRSEATSASE